jgi:hypothetical protein
MSDQHECPILGCSERRLASACVQANLNVSASPLVRFLKAIYRVLCIDMSDGSATLLLAACG